MTLNQFTVGNELTERQSGVG
ncbi:hypothetical protein AYI68_g1844, partial [Smittium mucronatum]